MSLSKNPAKYPEEFGQLLEAAIEGPISLPFATQKDAERFRGRMYGFLGALKKAVAEPDCPDNLRQLYQLSHKVQLSLAPGSSTLVVRPLDLDPDAQMLRHILSQPAGDHPVKGSKQILVPMNPDFLPPGLRELAIQRAEKGKQ